MPYPFLGNTGRTYPQFLDTGTGRTLVTEPGGTYGMAPVAGAPDLPVPPGDGLWGDAVPAEPMPAASEPDTPADPPVPRKTKPAKTVSEAPGE